MWFSNTPVSRVLQVPGINADADLGGVQWSFVIGLFYTPQGGNETLFTAPRGTSQNSSSRRSHIK